MKTQIRSPISLLGLVVWSIAATFFLYEFFLRTFIGTVAHEIIPELHLTAETFALVGSAYYLSYGIMQVPVGILADKFGVKRIMIFATIVCALATLWFAASTGFYSALASRMLMGFGSSFAFVCLLVISITWFPKEYFGFFAGLSQFIGTMGPLLAGGPLVLLLADMHGQWRLTLSFIAGFGFVLTVLIILFVKTKPRDGEQEMIYLRQEEPLLDNLKKLFKNAQAWSLALYSGFSYFAMALVGALWGTDFLQARGLSQASAADMISLAWLGYAIGCPLLGAFSDIAKRRKPFLMLTAILGIFLTLIIVYMPIGHHWIYAPLFFTLGITCTGQNIAFATISEHVFPTTRATALALNNTGITIFSSLLPPAVSWFIEQSAMHNAPNYIPQNFYLGFGSMPIAFLIALLIAMFFIKETYCRPQKEMIILNTSS